ncbi:peptidase, putative [Bodo saltans]|uniref:Peptidase, putative n=1 Tax=Bodo saltans TaxID=75058 RepID=A0A0S4J372_BODSA|nr:peptidase, putative [Bodo saltans]|eukprot:CUG85738.1 peptidase, putative [Bodo saltans]
MSNIDREKNLKVLIKNGTLVADILGMHHQLFDVASATLKPLVFLDALSSRISLHNRGFDPDGVKKMRRVFAALADKKVNYSTLQSICSGGNTNKFEVRTAVESLGISSSELRHCFACEKGAKFRMIINMWEAHICRKVSKVRSRIEIIHANALIALCKRYASRLEDSSDSDSYDDSDSSDDSDDSDCDLELNVAQLQSLGISASEWRCCGYLTNSKDEKHFSRKKCVEDIRSAVVRASSLCSVKYILDNCAALRFIGGKATNALIDELQFANRSKSPTNAWTKGFGLTCMFNPSCQWKTKSVDQPWEKFEEHVQSAHGMKSLELALTFDNRQYDVDNDPFALVSPSDLFLFQKQKGRSSNFFCPCCLFCGTDTLTALTYNEVRVHIYEHHYEENNVESVAQRKFSEQILLDFLQRESMKTSIFNGSYVQICAPADRLDERILIKRTKKSSAQCLVCNLQCSSHESANEHMLQLHPDHFKGQTTVCAQCACPPFASFHEFQQHYVDKHLDVSQRPLVCPFCAGTFVDEDPTNFKNHIKKAGRQMQCPIQKCSKQFDVVSELLDHLRGKKHKCYKYAETIGLSAFYFRSLLRGSFVPDRVFLARVSQKQLKSTTDLSGDLKLTNCTVTLKVRQSPNKDPRPFVNGPCCLWRMPAGQQYYDQTSIWSARTNGIGEAALVIPEASYLDEIHLAILDRPVAKLTANGTFSQLSDAQLANNDWPANQIEIFPNSVVNVQRGRFLQVTVTFRLRLLNEVAPNSTPSMPNVVKVAVIDEPIQLKHPMLEHSLEVGDLQPGAFLQPYLTVCHSKLKKKFSAQNAALPALTGALAASMQSAGLTVDGATTPHGTNVAGLVLVGANVQSNSTTVRTLQIRPYNVSYCQWRHLGITRAMSTELIVTQIYQAIDDGCAIINLSFAFKSGSLLDSDLEKAITVARNHHRVVIAAAGNDSETMQKSISFPAGAPGAVAVGALCLRTPSNHSLYRIPQKGRDHAVCAFSNNIVPMAKQGSFPDFLVLANGLQSYGPFPDNAYGVLAGTSMAAPIVSGFAGGAVCRHNGNLCDHQGAPDFEKIERIVESSLKKSSLSQVQQHKFVGGGP